MKMLTACKLIATALCVSHPAQAANPCYDRTLDMAKTVGHAHGLMEASQIVREKTRDEALARLLYDAAIAKQADADRQVAALLADGCR
jgi:hypothetical protein